MHNNSQKHSSVYLQSTSTANEPVITFGWYKLVNNRLITKVCGPFLENYNARKKRNQSLPNFVYFYFAKKQTLK